MTDGTRVWHYDGRSALRRDAVLVDDGDAFRLIEADRQSGPFVWTALVASDGYADATSFGLNKIGGWRIGFVDAVPAAVAAKLPGHQRYGGLVDRFGLWRASLGFAALAALAVTLVLRTPAAVARLVPASVEQRLGDVMVGDFGRRGCDTTDGLAALAALTERVDPGDRRIEVHVVAVPMVNAVTLPGGRIVIFAGLLKQAQSPDEVAGVLAHELGHVAHHDVTASLIRQLGLSVLLGGMEGHVGGFSNALLTSAYSRDAEAGADAFGMGLLRDADIAPGPTALFFRRLAREAGGSERMFSYVNSHPVSTDRANAFARSGRAGAVHRSALTPTQWQALQEICRGTPTEMHFQF